MGTYYIPRNVRGETRLFKIFSIKALIYTIVALIPGLIFNYIIGTLLKIKYVGLGVIVLFCLIGFIIGTFKMPPLTIAPIFKITSGEKIDDILLRIITFKRDKKIYVYGRKNK